MLAAAARAGAALVGVVLVATTLLSAIKTVVLPRAAPVRLTRLVFLAVRRPLEATFRPSTPYETKDRRMALFAPLGLVSLAFVWLLLVFLGAALLFGALGSGWRQALRASGSSLTTLGFATPDGLAADLLAFAEASVGLFLLALLITYLPTMYGAFARRELLVASLEIAAGAPSDPVEMLVRYHRIHGLDDVDDFWPAWQEWFADIEESHTSHPALVFFRSPQPDRSWATAAGTVLDAAALRVSAIDIPARPEPQLVVRAGTVSLRRIAAFFQIPFDPDPAPGDPITVGRSEFDQACAELAAAGVPLVGDRDAAWRAFQGWRVNYDTPLLALAGTTITPSSRWCGDRAPAYRPPALVRRRPGSARAG